jgi:hypothetical protein
MIFMRSQTAAAHPVAGRRSIRFKIKLIAVYVPDNSFSNLLSRYDCRCQLHPYIASESHDMRISHRQMEICMAAAFTISKKMVMS